MANSSISFKRAAKSITPPLLWKLLSAARMQVKCSLKKAKSLAPLTFPISEKGTAGEFPVTSDTIRRYIENPEKRNKYTFARVCRSVCSSDSDYIPKVEDAGKIYDKDGKKIQVMHQGVLIHQHSYSEDPERCSHDHLGTWTSDIIQLLRGHHEPQEEKAFYEVLKDIPEGGVMLELGCWWAYYSMWFNKAIPKAKNYLIEPNKTNLSFGKANFALNNMEGDFSRAFLGERLDTSIVGVTDPETPYISIDAFMKEKNIDFIDMLHSDIQGGEHKMLIDAEKTLKAHKVRYIFISTHGPKTHANCLNKLKAYDYHILCEHTTEQGCSGDGLIVARAGSIPGIAHIEITKYNYNWDDWKPEGVQ